MSKQLTMVTCGIVVTFGLGAMAAEKPPEFYSKAMKDIGAAAMTIEKATASEDYDSVSKSAAAIIDAFPPIEKYWMGKEDAIKFVQTASKAAADLRVMAGIQSKEGVAYSAKELAAVCTQCHMAHREAQADGTFLIK